jgi:hypothetical protein
MSRMMTLCSLAFFAACGLRADVTIRYQSDIKLAAGLPPMMEQAMKPALTKGSPLSIRMKGNKAWSMSGGIVEIVNLDKQELTLDRCGASYLRHLSGVGVCRQNGRRDAGDAGRADESLADAMSSIKTKVDSKVTGRTEVIQGVQAEEREIDISMDMPMPAGTSQTGPA